MPEHEVIQWTLYQSGKAEIITPIEMRQKVQAAANTIAQNHK